MLNAKMIDFINSGAPGNATAPEPAACKISSGLMPCQFVTLHMASNADEFYWILEMMVQTVQEGCNQAWKDTTNALLGYSF